MTPTRIWAPHCWQDIRQCFTDAHESFLPSQVLVRELRGIEESPWGDDELTASKLAKTVEAVRCQAGIQQPRRQCGATSSDGVP